MTISIRSTSTGADPVGAAPAPLAGLRHFSEAHRLRRPLSRAAFLTVLPVALLSFGGLATAVPPVLAPLRREAVEGGLLALALAALFPAAAGVLASLLVVAARARTIRPPAPAGRLAGLWRRVFRARPLPPVSHAANWPQGLLLLLVTGLAGEALWRFWPRAELPVSAPESCLLLGGGALLLAFPMLVGERYFSTLGPQLLPEAENVRALLFLPAAGLPFGGLLEILRGLGFAWTHWAFQAATLYLAIVSGELALRTLGVWFMPPPEPERARAAVGSVAAKLLRPGTLSPEALVETVRDRLGIDFARSWAIAYIRSAFAPVLLAMLSLGWFLSGVVAVGLDQRGVYERFGAPVAVLKPGLHLTLPWPFGRVRRVDYGVVHAVAIAYGDAGAVAEARPPDAAPTDAAKIEDAQIGNTQIGNTQIGNAGAEDEAPASANRLWDQGQGTDVSYVIASAVSGRQSFEVVSANLRVLYRIGLDDMSARRALYRARDPEALVRATAGRLLARFFAVQTLGQLLGEDRDRIAHALEAEEQAALDRLDSGIEVVSVVIEAIQPPRGAADAYHAVQAAEIVADTGISEERGRAGATVNVARRQAHEATNQAAGHAADLAGDAEVTRLRFQADQRAYRSDGDAFLLERYFEDLKTALPPASIEIVDSRLAAGLPIVDLRPPTDLPAGPLENGTP